MHRFYLPPEQCGGALLCLADREAHHALHVLRLQRGERVTVLDGAGNQFLCDVQTLERKTIQLAVVEKITAAPRNCAITLLQAVPKGKMFEDIVDKATQLGVGRIVPILSERVTMRLELGDAARKVEKWRQVAIETSKQCGSPWLPQIDAPLAPNRWLEGRESFDLTLVGSLQTTRRHPREYLAEFQKQNGRLPKTVAVWIGPEGDFTLAEMAAIEAAGAKPITLGPLVLRAETAAVYCLSILNYELQV
jgi:16S rRNA (uracil1498-N3)-methyltransferase